MEYWKGMMNWTLDPSWRCEICGSHNHDDSPVLVFNGGLTWGLQHGECRCDICHAEYYASAPEGAQFATLTIAWEPLAIQFIRFQWEQTGIELSRWSAATWAKVTKFYETEKALKAVTVQP